MSGRERRGADAKERLGDGTEKGRRDAEELAALVAEAEEATADEPQAAPPLHDPNERLIDEARDKLGHLLPPRAPVAARVEVAQQDGSAAGPVREAGLRRRLAEMVRAFVGGEKNWRRPRSIYGDQDSAPAAPESVFVEPPISIQDELYDRKTLEAENIKLARFKTRLELIYNETSTDAAFDSLNKLKENLEDWINARKKDTASRVHPEMAMVEDMAHREQAMLKLVEAMEDELRSRAKGSEGGTTERTAPPWQKRPRDERPKDSLDWWS